MPPKLMNPKVLLRRILEGAPAIVSDTLAAAQQPEIPSKTNVMEHS